MHALKIFFILQFWYTEISINSLASLYPDESIFEVKVNQKHENLRKKCAQGEAAGERDLVVYKTSAVIFGYIVRRGVVGNGL